MLRNSTPSPAAFAIFSLAMIFRSQWATKSTNPCLEMVPQMTYKCMKKNLSIIPPDIPNTTQSLDLSFNPLGTLTSNYFSWLFALKYLDLTRCNIQKIEDDTFVGLGNLSTLILTGNPLKFLGPRAFHDLTSLERLIVLETNQSSLDSLPIGQLRSLRELNLKNNYITSLKFPKLFSQLMLLQHLDLQSNKISSIFRGDLDALKSRNFTLVLSMNDIKFIERNAFAGFYLQKLILRACFENSTTMEANLRNLNGLHVNSLVLGEYRNNYKLRTFSKNLFDGLCQINLQEITLISLRFDLEDTKVLSDCFNNISNIRLVHTDVTNVKELPRNSRIRHLEFKDSGLQTVPVKSLSSLKELKVLSITQSKDLRDFELEFSGLRNLEHLDLSRNGIIATIMWHRLMVDLPYLKHLNLSFNNKIQLSVECLGSSELQTMDLKHTRLIGPGSIPVFRCLTHLIYLDITKTETHIRIQCSFCGLENLKVLKMAENSFLENKLVDSFKNLIKLQVLDISHCKLEHISINSLAHLCELQELDVSCNKLLNLPPDIYANLQALRILDFHSNQLAALTEKDIVSLSKRLTSLDLSHNLFDCSCEHLNFLRWAIDNRNLFQHSENMVCHSPVHLKDSVLLSIDLSFCEAYTITVAVSLTMGLVLVVSLILVYKYYFHLYYMFLLLSGGHPSTEEDSFYDAFVIYSSEDQEWVTQELEETLEAGIPNFRLCLFYRDFIPGMSIITNIIKVGFQRSRKVIAVISEHFLESHWCNFELEMAQSWQLLDSRANLVIIILEGVDQAVFQRKLGLFRYLRRNTYLIWRDMKLNRHLFLRQLRMSLLEGIN